MAREDQLMAGDSASAVEDLDSIEDRRAQVRRTVLKQVKIYPVKDLAGLAIRNISRHGLMGEASANLLQLQRVHMSFDSHRFVEGQVRWIHGTRFGLSFEGLIPLPLELESHHESETWLNGGLPGEGLDRREPREMLNLDAIIAVTRPVLGGIVRNISTGGAQIETHHRLAEGSVLLVQLAGRPALLSRVQWSRGNNTGVKFSEPAPADLLQSPGEGFLNELGTKSRVESSLSITVSTPDITGEHENGAGENSLHH
jgi:hypothetical protein